MRHIAIIALNTFRESVRSKILYSTFFFAVLIVLVTTVFGSVTIGDQVKVIEDFGLFCISFFSVVYIVIAGATLLEKELAKKTIFNLLAKPVNRDEFVLGKFFGLLMTAVLMAVIMTAALVGYVTLFTGELNFLLFAAGLFTFVELAVVCAAALFFSALVVTPILNGLFTFSVFLAGRSIEYVTYFIAEGEVEGPLKALLQALYYVLPHLDKTNFANSVVYGVAVPTDILWSSVLYGVGYSGALLTLACLIFRKREFA